MIFREMIKSWQDLEGLRTGPVSGLITTVSPAWTPAPDDASPLPPPRSSHWGSLLQMKLLLFPLVLISTTHYAPPQSPHLATSPLNKTLSLSQGKQNPPD